MAFIRRSKGALVPTMADFSNLADDPHAQKTLGEAFVYLEQKDDTETAAVVRTMTESERLYFVTASSAMDAISNRKWRGHKSA